MICKIVSITLSISILLFLSACSSLERVSKENAKEEEEHIYGVWLQSGEFVEFEPGGGELKDEGGWNNSPESG